MQNIIKTIFISLISIVVIGCSVEPEAVERRQGDTSDSQARTEEREGVKIRMRLPDSLRAGFNLGESSMSDEERLDEERLKEELRDREERELEELIKEEREKDERLERELEEREEKEREGEENEEDEEKERDDEEDVEDEEKEESENNEEEETDDLRFWAECDGDKNDELIGDVAVYFVIYSGDDKQIIEFDEDCAGEMTLGLEDLSPRREYKIKSWIELDGRVVYQGFSETFTGKTEFVPLKMTKTDEKEEEDKPQGTVVTIEFDD